MANHIRFDWAIKRLLRNKANFQILEGFLSELLGKDVTISTILESEGNKQEEVDKFNKVDILVKTTQGELMLVEVQNDAEVDYFHRMVYGICKLITEYIQEGEQYGVIKKAFSINIVYFGLGQGEDYVYEYRGDFVGTHNGDILRPTAAQQEKFQVGAVADIFPRYYLLKVNNFNVAKDSLDEWIYFLKNNKIEDSFKAKGLPEARQRLNVDNLPDEERQGYKRYMENRRLEKSVMMTAEFEGYEKGMQKGIEEGIGQGVEKERKAMIINGAKAGLSVEVLAQLTGLTITEVEKVINEDKPPF